MLKRKAYDPFSSPIYLQVQTNEYLAVAAAGLQVPQSNTKEGPGKTLRVQILRDGQEQPDGGWNVLVGQRIDASLLIEGAGANDTVLHGWQRPDGIPFLDYQASTDSGVLTPFPHESDDFLHGTEISFYWADAGAHNVLCNVRVGDVWRNPTALFDVAAPTWKEGTVDGGKARVYPTQRDSIQPGVGLYNKKNLNLKDWGILSKVTVDLDPRWAAGEWLFVQLVDPDYLNESTEETWATKASLRGKYSLDNWWPYPQISKNLLNGGPQPSIWKTNTGEHWVGDTPEMRFGMDPNQFRWRAAGQFKTYVMFKPSGDFSVWVPVLVVNWSFTAEAERNNKTYSLKIGEQQIPDSYQPTTDHPVWDTVAKNKEYMEKING